MTAKKDLARYRATYDKAYPTEQESYKQRSNDFQTTDKIVVFDCKRVTFRSGRFTRCNFFSQPVQDVTFHECHFKDSWLTPRFSDVSFTHCIFERVDFMRAKFENCTFRHCTFLECSAWKVSFRATSIHAGDFLRGVKFLKSNYSDKNAQEMLKQESRFVTTRVAIASQLLHAAEDVSKNSELFDTALYEYRKIENHYQYYLLTTKEELDSLRKFCTSRKHYWILVAANWAKFFFEYSFLKTTAGGTSLLRLTLISMGLVFIVYPVVFETMAINHHGENLPDLFRDETGSWSTLNLSFATWWEKSLASIELLLAFGFTSFQARDLYSHSVLVLQAMIGIAWYALLVPVLLRRTYSR